MESLIAFLFAATITLFFVRNYVKGMKQREAAARQAAEMGKLFSDGPRGMHPHIDITNCIGCAACSTVCPEGDVIAMIGGQDQQDAIVRQGAIRNTSRGLSGLSNRAI